MVSQYAGANLNIGETISTSLSNRFEDIDGDILTYLFNSSNPSIATVSLDVNGTDIEIIGLALGATEVTVTASDNHGDSVTMIFTVTVNQLLTSPPTGGISVLDAPKKDEIFVYAPEGFTVKLYDSEIEGNLI